MLRLHLVEHTQQGHDVDTANPTVYLKSSNVARSRAGSKFRTYAAGEGPMAFTTRSIDAMMLDTRPKASPAAMNATTSRSSFLVKRRTIWMGSVAESATLKLLS